MFNPTNHFFGHFIFFRRHLENVIFWRPDYATQNINFQKHSLIYDKYSIFPSFPTILFNLYIIACFVWVFITSVKSRLPNWNTIFINFSVLGAKNLKYYGCQSQFVKWRMTPDWSVFPSTMTMVSIYQYFVRDLCGSQLDHWCMKKQ